MQKISTVVLCFMLPLALYTGQAWGLVSGICYIKIKNTTPIGHGQIISQTYQFTYPTYYTCITWGPVQCAVKAWENGHRYGKDLMKNRGVDAQNWLPIEFFNAIYLTSHYHHCIGNRHPQQTPEPEFKPLPFEKPLYPRFSDNIKPKSPTRRPIMLPITPPLGAPYLIPISPSSPFYPFAAEVLRILNHPDIKTWAVVAIAGILSVASVIAALSASSTPATGPVGMGVSVASIASAGAAIIFVCHLADIEIDEQALKPSLFTSSMIETDAPPGKSRVLLFETSKRDAWTIEVDQDSQQVGAIIKDGECLRITENGLLHLPKDDC